jgi:hypothetical protein
MSQLPPLPPIQGSGDQCASSDSAIPGPTVQFQSREARERDLVQLYLQPRPHALDGESPRNSTVRSEVRDEQTTFPPDLSAAERESLFVSMAVDEETVREEALRLRVDRHLQQQIAHRRRFRERLEAHTQRQQTFTNNVHVPLDSPIDRELQNLNPTHARMAMQARLRRAAAAEQLEEERRTFARSAAYRDDTVSHTSQNSRQLSPRSRPDFTEPDLEEQEHRVQAYLRAQLANRERVLAAARRLHGISSASSQHEGYQTLSTSTPEHTRVPATYRGITAFAPTRETHRVEQRLPFRRNLRHSPVPGRRRHGLYEEARAATVAREQALAERRQAEEVMPTREHDFTAGYMDIQYNWGSFSRFSGGSGSVISYSIPPPPHLQPAYMQQASDALNREAGSRHEHQHSQTSSAGVPQQFRLLSTIRPPSDARIRQYQNNMLAPPQLLQRSNSSLQFTHTPVNTARSVYSSVYTLSPLALPEATLPLHSNSSNSSMRQATSDFLGPSTRVRRYADGMLSNTSSQPTLYGSTTNPNDQGQSSVAGRDENPLRNLTYLYRLMLNRVASIDSGTDREQAHTSLANTFFDDLQNQAVTQARAVRALSPPYFPPAIVFAPPEVDERSQNRGFESHQDGTDSLPDTAQAGCSSNADSEVSTVRNFSPEQEREDSLSPNMREDLNLRYYHHVQHYSTQLHHYAVFLFDCNHQHNNPHLPDINYLRDIGSHFYDRSPERHAIGIDLLATFIRAWSNIGRDSPGVDNESEVADFAAILRLRWMERERDIWRDVIRLHIGTDLFPGQPARTPAESTRPADSSENSTERDAVDEERVGEGEAEELAWIDPRVSAHLETIREVEAEYEADEESVGET